MEEITDEDMSAAKLMLRTELQYVWKRMSSFSDIVYSLCASKRRRRLVFL
jgi:hypothetical protein